MIEAELPDGTILEFPDGTAPEVMQRVVKQRIGSKAPAQEKSGALQTLGNIGAGAVRGAGSIGATILAPWDIAKDAMAGKGLSLESNRERRAAMDAGLASMGAETDSFGYGAGKLAGEIAGTAGVPGVLAKGAQALKASPALVQALRTSGMSSGGQTGAKALATRVAGGAATGGASAASADPEQISTGAAIGAAIPVLGKTLSLAGKVISPEKLMQSALKPTLAQQKSGEAKAAIDTLLKYGINATQGGADKLKSMVSGVDDEISNLIAGSGKTVSKDKVLASLDDVKSRFTNQVSPTADIAAIQNVGADFAQHPLVSAGDIPIELAQKLKQGTYKVLDKKYGQIGTAETEAQKGLARGLKEQIAEAIPEVAPLNAKQSELIKALKVTSRRAMMDENRNPVGIAGLSTSAPQLVGMLADRSALLKSLAARGIKAITPEENNALINALRQGVYRGSPVALSGD